MSHAWAHVTPGIEWCATCGSLRHATEQFRPSQNLRPGDPREDRTPTWGPPYRVIPARTAAPCGGAFRMGRIG